MKTNILESNILIAEKLMNYEYISKEQSYDAYGWWKKDTYNGDAFRNPNFICVDSRQLEFHNDWNKLMKCVEIIAKNKDTSILNCLMVLNNFFKVEIMIDSMYDLFDCIVNYLNRK